MATIVTRSGKGSPLTSAELDQNQINLNTDKAELSGATFTGAITANAGVVVDNITIDGQEIDVSSGDLTLDVAGDIILDADGGDWRFKDAGAEIFKISSGSGFFAIKSQATDADIKFQGNDGGSEVTALTLDMSDEGAAIFNGHGTFNDTVLINSTSSGALTIAGSGGGINFTGGNNRVLFNSNRALEGATDGSTLTVGENYTAINIDGAATFTGAITANAGVVFNENSADLDFRVESNGNTHMLFVDGGNDSVSIGTSTQSAVLTIHSAGNGYSNGAIALKGAGISDTNYLTNAGGNFYISHNGTNDDFVLGGGGLIINESGVDRDVRIESDGNANMLFVDGGNNAVGIGTGSPSGSGLHVHNSSGGEQYISSSNSALRLVSTGGINYIQSGTATSSSSAAPLVFTNVGGTGEVFRIAADGVAHFNGDVKVLSGDIQMGSGRGINFSASSNAGGMTSETLDDYEEGTWTAQVKYGGVSGTAATLSEAGGSYTKIGRQVTVNFEIDVSNTNSGSGLVNITGLPFTIADIITPTGLEASGTVVYFGGFSTGVNSLGISADSSGALILYGLTNSTQTGVSVITASIMGTGEIRGSISYFTNQ